VHGFISSMINGFYQVRSMGTEDRRPPEEFLPENPTPYDYIVFRATEVKDLAIEKNTPVTAYRSVHDDPAVLGVSNTSLLESKLFNCILQCRPPLCLHTGGTQFLTYLISF
jgi:hypothetical protein